MDAFQTLSEIAVGIAGFGTIAIVLGRKASVGSSEYFRTSALFIASLGALFLSLIPVGLGASDIDSETIWRISSLSIALYSLGFGIVMPNLRKRYLNNDLWFGPVVYASLAIVTFISGFLQLGNVSKLIDPPNPTVVFFGISWFLFYACLILVRIVFIPPKSDSDEA